MWRGEFPAGLLLDALSPCPGCLFHPQSYSERRPGDDDPLSSLWSRTFFSSSPPAASSHLFTERLCILSWDAPDIVCINGGCWEVLTVHHSHCLRFGRKRLRWNIFWKFLESLIFTWLTSEICFMREEVTWDYSSCNIELRSIQFQIDVDVSIKVGVLVKSHRCWKPQVSLARCLRDSISKVKGASNEIQPWIPLVISKRVS